VALILCGAGFLLPYNSFITAVDYYQGKYPQSTIVFDMSLTYICSAFVGVVLNNILVEKLSLSVRVTFGYVLSFTMLLFIAICDVALTMFSPAVSYRITLVAVTVVALGCTVQQSSFYGYTSMLPARYTQAVMTGESAAGLIVSVNRILTKAMMQDVHRSTLLFFALSIIFVLVCCTAFHVTRRTDFVHFYVGVCQQAIIQDDQRAIMRPTAGAGALGNAEEVDILDSNGAHDSYGVLVMQSPPGSTNDQSTAVFIPDHAHHYQRSNCNSEQNNSNSKWLGHAYRQHLSMWDTITSGFVARCEVSKRIWPYMTSIGLVYFVTLCLFPGIESEIVSCRLSTWMPIILIAVFNLFDFIGKVFSAVQFDWPLTRLVVCSLSRLILIPLMMICAAPRDHPLVTGEFWPVCLSACLGLSNGYFGSVPMILAPSRVPDHQKELTGNIMTLSYSIGLTTGSAIAYLLNTWLGPHTSADLCSINANMTYADNDVINSVTAKLNIFYDFPASDFFPG
jgi:solute carrier family 29 (equilibrative nucleoside transporter) protein 4